jgi:hypothetical protein
VERGERGGKRVRIERGEEKEGGGGREREQIREGKRE